MRALELFALTLAGIGLWLMQVTAGWIASLALFCIWSGAVTLIWLNNR